ncbi:hypothetical protein CHUAL_002293 [Chamberlinius hualienensis]
MSKIPRSPTAVDTTCDLSPPEWKKELIRRKTLQKRVFIRLPNSLLQREKNVAINSPPPSTQPSASSSAATTNGEHLSTGAKAISNTANNKIAKSIRDEVDIADGVVLNGFTMTKTHHVNKLSSSTSVDSAGGLYSATSGSEYASVNQTWRNKPLVSSNNNEYDVIRAWLPQSGGEGGTNDVTTAEGMKKSHDTSNDVVDSWRVSDGRKGGVSPMHFQQGIKAINRSKEAMGDASVKNGYEMHFVNGKSDLQHEIDGLNGNEEKDGDFDPDFDYGPGIVNRLKAKFITLSLRGEPGISNHMAPPVSPISPVRRVASMEHLLDVLSDDEHSNPSPDNLTHGLVGRTKGLYEKNANALRNSNYYSRFQNSTKLKRARSMDNVTAIDRAGLTIPKDFLASKNVIIIEQPKPQPTTQSEAPNKSPSKATTTNLSPNSLSNGEYPLPNTVREYMKLFEHPDENKNALVVVGAGGVGGSSTLGGVNKSVKPKITVSKPALVASSLRIGFGVSKSVPSANCDQQLPPPADKDQNCIQHNNNNFVNKVPTIDTEPQPNSPEVENISSSVKCRIDAFSDLTSKLQQQPHNNINNKPLVPSANATDTANVKDETPKIVVAPIEIQKPVGAITPVPREQPKSQVEETVTPKPPKIVDYKLANHQIQQQNDQFNQNITADDTLPVTNGGNPFVQLRSYHSTESNTMIISIDDSKPRPAHLPNINNKQNIHYEQDETDNDKYYGSEDDDDDGSVDTTDSKSVNFIGANVIAGKSALLKTRNKKLQLLFDDKAVSTYEYPSEWTLINDRSDSDECEDNDTTNCDNNTPNNTVSKPNEVDSDFQFSSPSTTMLNSSPALNLSGGLGNYTPMAVCGDQVFQLGISRAPQSPTVTANVSSNSLQIDSQDDEDSALSLKPAADDENVLWSSTQTSDILF